MIDLPPGLWLLLGGLLLPLLPRRRTWLVVGPPLVALQQIIQVPDGVVLTWTFLDYQLIPLRGEGAGRLFATAFALAALAGGLFALKRASTLELAAAYVYAGAAILVTLAGDWLTLFICWEIMAVASAVVILAGQSERAQGAAFRYLIIHLLGGVLLMAGIVGQMLTTGSLVFGPVSLAGPAQWLILIGILVNAAAPPLWSWVADAYPEASPTGTVFLSAFTTKTAVFVLWTAFPGAAILIPLGLVMVWYGAIYALLEDNIRRLLAYSIVSQVGYMVVAIGIGTPLALNGAAAHAFAHILYKALLLMAAGAVIFASHRQQLSELGGLARTMPWTAACATVGAFTLAAMPLTSAFASKALITQAAADLHLGGVWFALTAASALAVLYVGLRLPWLVFFDRDRGLRPPEAPPNMGLAMGLLAGLCLLLGCWPGLLYGLLPFTLDYQLFTAAHLLAQWQLLGFAALMFFLALPWLRSRPGVTLDLDWFYRRPGFDLLCLANRRFLDGRDRLEDELRAWLGRLLVALSRHRGPYGELARTWPTGSMVLWVAVLLATCLVFYYF